MEINYDKSKFDTFAKRPSNFKTLFTSIQSSWHCSSNGKFRLRFWICGSVRMMKTINYKFVICRKLDKFFASLRMASSPNKRLKPSLPWQYTIVDLLGPYTIKGEVN